MAGIHPPNHWLMGAGLTIEELTQRSGLEARVVEAIAAGRYTPSPVQRRQIAGVLGLSPEVIAWGHASSVESRYGHGPQFGRSP